MRKYSCHQARRIVDRLRWSCHCSGRLPPPAGQPALDGVLLPAPRKTSRAPQGIDPSGQAGQCRVPLAAARFRLTGRHAPARVLWVLAFAIVGLVPWAFRTLVTGEVAADGICQVK